MTVKRYRYLDLKKFNRIVNQYNQSSEDIERRPDITKIKDESTTTEELDLDTSKYDDEQSTTKI